MITRLFWASGLLCLAAAAGAQVWTLDRSVVAGGGELYAESADQRWQLSGTLGQAEPSAVPARGDGWALRGGFWSGESAPPSPRLFADGFEAVAVPAGQQEHAVAEGGGAPPPA